MYNKSIKEQYLKFVDISDLFEQFSSIESIFEKDLYDFNIQEMGILFKTLRLDDNEEAVKVKNEISNYISWAIDNSVKTNNINPLASLDDEWVDQFIV
jgi:hypothetical protein